ncbi:peptidase S8, partial [Halobium palmae]
MGTFSRRRLLATTGAVMGGIAVGAGPGSAAGENERFLIDLREISREDVPADVEIVHDVSEIDVLAARGDPELVPESCAVVVVVSVDQHG